MAQASVSADSPEALFVRWRDTGDAAALAAIFDAEAPVLFRLAISLGSDPALAEEAVQETFLAAMESADRWDEARPVGPWLTGILRIKVLEVRRRERRRPDPVRVRIPPAPEDPVVASAAAEDVDRVRAAIRALPEPYRHAALLRWCYGLEPAEIADLRGEPPGTTWSILSRALARLRKSLGALPILGALGEVPRGFEAMREGVLRRGAELRPPGGSAGGTVEPTATTTAAAAAAAVLIALLAGGALWSLRESGAPSAPPRPSTSEGTTAAAAAHAATAPHLPGNGRTGAEGAPPGTALPPPVDLAGCDRLTDLHGQVVDATGAPVPGAAVSVVTRPWRDLFVLGGAVQAEERPLGATTASTDGTFRLALPRGSWVDLRVTGPGGATARLGWRQAGERVRVVLGERPSLRATVVDAGGSPLAGIRLVPGAMDETGRKRTLPGAVTGADGVALLEDLPPGTVWVHADDALWRESAAAFFTLPAAGTREGRIVLARGRAVPGVVVDAGTGAPVAGALLGAGGSIFTPLRTGADGRFTYGAPADDATVVLAVRAEGYAPGRHLLPTEGEARIALGPEAVLEGRLLGADGAPVAGAAIAAVVRLPGLPGRSGVDAVRAESGADGRFRVGGLAPGVPCTLVAEAAGHGRLLRDAVPALPGEPSAALGDLALPAARRLEGEVLDAEGRPLADVPVLLEGPLGPSAAGALVPDVGRRTDDRGRFRIGDRGPGEYVLVVPGTAERSPVRAVVRIPSEADPAPVRLAVAAGRATEFLATDPDGAPIPGLAVTVSWRGGQRSARTDAAGRALLALRDGEPIGVHVADLGERPLWVGETPGGARLTADGRPLHFVLRRAAPVRGRVLGPDGAPAPGVALVLRDEEGTWIGRGESDPAGAFAVPAPAGRACSVRAAGGAGLVARADGVVAGGAAADLVLGPPGTRSLRVTVVDAAGRPVPRAVLAGPVLPDGTLPTADRRGRVVLADLPAEEILLRLLPAAAGGGALPAECAPPLPVRVLPEGQEVVLAGRPGRALRGTVRAPGGGAAAGARVLLELADGSRAAAAADGEGRFTAWIPAGVAVLRGTARAAGAAGPGVAAVLGAEAFAGEEPGFVLPAAR